MDKKQIATMSAFGYSIEELKGLKVTPRMTFYNREGNPIEGLPADSYHMARYLKRGFTLTPPSPKTEPQGEPIGFTCETCGKVVSTRLALAGHKRSHKVKLEVK